MRKLYTWKLEIGVGLDQVRPYLGQEPEVGREWPHWFLWNSKFFQSSPLQSSSLLQIYASVDKKGKISL